MFEAFLSWAQGMGTAMSVDSETNAASIAYDREIQNAERNAELARAAGVYNASRQQDKANLIFGTQRADVGATGTEASSGNVFDLLRQSKTNAELDRLAILHEADLQVQNYKNQAAGLAAEKSANVRSSEKRKWAAIIGGAAGAAAKWPGGADPSPTHNPVNNYSSTGGGGYGSAGGNNRGFGGYA